MAPLTLGVEEEFFALDATTRRLAVDATPILTRWAGGGTGTRAMPTSTA